MIEILAYIVLIVEPVFKKAEKLCRWLSRLLRFRTSQNSCSLSSDYCWYAYVLLEVVGLSGVVESTSTSPGIPRALKQK